MLCALAAIAPQSARVSDNRVTNAIRLRAQVASGHHAKKQSLAAACLGLLCCTVHLDFGMLDVAPPVSISEVPTNETVGSFAFIMAGLLKSHTSDVG